MYSLIRFLGPPSVAIPSLHCIICLFSVSHLVFVRSLFYLSVCIRTGLLGSYELFYDHDH